MDDRTDNITKGKTKSDEETKRLLKEWDELTMELNSLGPTCHTSLKWRRIWTKIKSNRKRKSGEVSGVSCREESKKVKCKFSVIS